MFRRMRKVCFPFEQLKKEHSFETNSLFIMIYLMKSTTLKPHSIANERNTLLKLDLLQIMNTTIIE